MRNVRQRRASFDYLAPLYDWFEKAPSAERIRRDLSLAEEEFVLDLGGGTGRVAVGVRQYAAELVVCDVSMGMMQRARHRRGLDCVCAPAERLPFAGERFNAILVMDALHHFSDIPGALAEIARVVKPGGRVLFEEPDISKSAGRIVAFLEHLFGFRSRFLPPGVLAASLRELGFEVIELGGDALRTRLLARRPGRRPGDGGAGQGAPA